MQPKNKADWNDVFLGREKPTDPVPYIARCPLCGGAADYEVVPETRVNLGCVKTEECGVSMTRPLHESDPLPTLLRLVNAWNRRP